MSPTSAVVTGAASGLGLAVVQALTADGARVVGVDLPGDERAAIVADSGATFLACDVTSSDDWGRWPAGSERGSARSISSPSTLV